METKYCKISEIKNHLIVENFPNPQIKTCVTKDGIIYRLHIIYPEDKIEINPLTLKNALWYTGKNENITMLTVNWFPTNLVAGVNENGRYSQNTKLSQITGYVDSVNTGSRSHCFLTEKVQKAIDILVKNGFEIDKIKSLQNKIITEWVEKLNKIGYPDARIYIDDEEDGDDIVKVFQGAILDKKHPNYHIINNNQKDFEKEVAKKILKEYLSYQQK